MNVFELMAVLLTVSAIMSYINYRTVRLPDTIGLMLIALVSSLVLVAAGKLGLHFEEETRVFLDRIDFEQTLLHGMLSFLLFAGALHVNLEDLSRQKFLIGILATAGVVGSTFLVGFLAWWLFGLIGLGLPLMYCFLFGALISPTDPIAVLGILKKAGVPKSLETKIVGESLFNDGVAVVVFLVLLDLASGGQSIGVSEVLTLFVTEVVGGVVFGLVAGGVVYWMLRRVDDYQVEVLITLALVTGGYALAEWLHLSAPIAIVVAGLLIGNHGRFFAMSEKSREHLDLFWELVDGILNAVLFVLIGLEVLVLTVSGRSLLAGLVAIPLVLAVRLVSVSIPVFILGFFRSFSPGVIRVLTWSGVRGGISVAMALALPVGPERDVLLTITYVVVAFSIIVQGLTIGPLARSVKE